MNSHEFFEQMLYHKIPPHMHAALKGYILKGEHTGSFIESLMANDLMAAVSKADDVNRTHLVNWVMYIYNDAPAACHGSYEKVDAWVNAGGMRQYESQTTEVD